MVAVGQLPKHTCNNNFNFKDWDAEIFDRYYSQKMLAEHRCWLSSSAKKCDTQIDHELFKLREQQQQQQPLSGRPLDVRGSG